GRETGGVVGGGGGGGGGLTGGASTEVPHWLQRTLSEAIGLPAHKLRVVAPEVGGGFGVKTTIYPEDVLIPAIALRVGRPVKWIQGRREHLARAPPPRKRA